MKFTWLRWHVYGDAHGILFVVLKGTGACGTNQVRAFENARDDHLNTPILHNAIPRMSDPRNGRNGWLVNWVREKIDYLLVVFGIPGIGFVTMEFPAEHMRNHPNTPAAQRFGAIGGGGDIEFLSFPISAGRIKRWWDPQGFFPVDPYATDAHGNPYWTRAALQTYLNDRCPILPEHAEEFFRAQAGGAPPAYPPAAAAGAAVPAGSFPARAGQAVTPHFLRREKFAQVGVAGARRPRVRATWFF